MSSVDDDEEMTRLNDERAVVIRRVCVGLIVLLTEAMPVSSLNDNDVEIT